MKDQPKIIRISIDDLHPHPFNKQISPLPDTQSDEWNAMVKSVEEGGIFTPLIVSRNGDVWHVVDGMRRYHAAKATSLDDLDCVEVSDADAARIIVDSMVARKRLSPGAIAYFSIPLEKEFKLSRESRRVASIANLRAGKNKQNTNVSPIRNVAGRETIEDRAKRLGVAARTLDAAIKVYEFLHDPKATDIASKLELAGKKKENANTYQAEARLKYEAMLASGEMAIGHILPAIAGDIWTKGVEKVKPVEIFKNQFKAALEKLVNLKKNIEFDAAFFTVLKDFDKEGLERIIETNKLVTAAAHKRLGAIVSVEAAKDV